MPNSEGSHVFRPKHVEMMSEFSTPKEFPFSHLSLFP